MLRLTELKLPPDHPEAALREAFLKRLGAAAPELVSLSIVRRGVDARRKSAIAVIYTLDVTVGDASRMFSGTPPEVVKPALQTLVAAGTADAVIPDVGDAAIFKADSPVYVCASAYLKGRILQVRLDGADAREKKDQVIALLKTAASRF